MQFSFSALMMTGLMVISSIAQARIDEVLREADTQNWQKTEVVRVNTARVVGVNYDLLAEDFANLRRGQNEGEQDWKNRLDAWVLNETAFILEDQVTKSTANTQISATQEKRAAYRPKGYNRAHVLPVTGGLMDVKGTGIMNAKPGNKTDGLASLGEVIREVLFEKLVDRVFKHSGIEAKTVGNYAVVDFGFDIIHSDNSRSRAGYILRQAHKRAEGFNSSLSPEERIRIEQTLRRYGLTSSGETMNGAYDFDYTNIQGTSNKAMTEVIDFGAFMVIDSFTRRLTVDTRAEISRPGSADFVQPDPDLRASLDQWGDFGTHDPKMDKPWIWSHELAQALAEGRADRSAFDQHIQNFMAPFETKLRNYIGTCHKVYQ